MKIKSNYFDHIDTDHKHNSIYKLNNLEIKKIKHILHVYDKIFGRYPEHEHEGKAVIEFINHNYT